MKKHLRVLIVDDNAGILETLADILADHGMTADTALDGPEAEGMLRKTSYDAAVVDFMLPSTTGVDFIKRLAPAYPGTRFVIMTAYADSQVARDTLEKSGIEVLHKPVEPEALIRRLEQLGGG
jgi:DNA-binding NtrC family response regulator